MDPLSATLAALALATALKDIIELVNNIRDTFSKLPSNYKNAAQLMEDIRETLDAMNSAYREELEDLDKNGKMMESFANLKKELLHVYSKCSVMIPQAKTTRMVKYKNAMKSFWNKEETEEMILELKQRVDKCLRLFNILSSMRTEYTVNGIDRNLKDALNSSKLGIIAGSPHSVDAHSIPPPPYIPHTPFSASSSTTSTRMPKRIPAQDMSKAYIIRELDILDQALQSLSDRWFESPPGNLEIPPVVPTWLLDLAPMPKSDMNRNALMLIYQVRDDIKAAPKSWVLTVDAKLHHLSALLSGLDLYEEVISIQNTRIDIWTAMATVYPGSNASGYLVNCLTGLSEGLSNMKYTDRVLSTTKQAIDIIDSTAQFSTDAAAQDLMAQILAIQSKHVSGPRSSLEMAESSVRRIESALGVDAQANHDGFAVAIPVTIKINNAMRELIFTYSSVLLTLAEMQLANELYPDSRRIAKRSLGILKQLSFLYPQSSKIIHHLVAVLTHLAHPKMANFNTVEENWNFAVQRAKLLEGLVSIDPQRYVIPFMSSLATKYHILTKEGALRDAQKIHQQIIGLGNLAVDTQSGVKVPSDTEAEYFSKLAEYHFESKRFQDSIYAAQNAVAQFSALETVTPGRYSARHFGACVFLCNSLAVLQQYDTCIAEGFKALDILDHDKSPGGRDITLIDKEMQLLDKLMEVLDATADSRALDWARDINSRIQSLFAFAQGSECKITVSNAQAPNKYASILKKHDLIEEAALYLEGTLERWPNTYGGSMDNSMLGVSYLQTLMELPDTFKSKGETAQALKYTVKAMEVAEGFFEMKGFEILKTVIYNNLASTHIHLLNDAGRYTEALELSKHAVQFARENEDHAQTGTNILAQALGARTFCQLYALQPREAIATATEALALCETALKAPHTVANNINNKLGVLYLSYLNLADAYADAGDVDAALVYLDEAKATLLKQAAAANQDADSNVHAHQVIATKKSRMLFAKGKHAEAVTIIAQVIVIERERAKTVKAMVASLIKALQFGGIAYCALGRHDEGARAANEVRELKTSIADSPGLVSLVEVEERRMTSRGLWKSVDNAKRKLKCHHQDSIFEKS